MSRPLILVTNDDGIVSRGIKALTEVALEFGDVVVVAPSKPQSGMGHAITLTKPIRLFEVDYLGKQVITAQKCTGTPVDCVKIAVDKVLDRKPDLCLSGINHGSNASINVIYSGTMSAAMEAAMEGINAIGFSLLNFASKAEMETSKLVVRKIVENVLAFGMPKSNLLNVNIPDVSPEYFKGIKFCRQAIGRWKENYLSRRDPSGKNYYWMTGNFICKDKKEDTDIWALEHNYASVVPVMYDLTELEGLNFLNENWK